MIRTAILVSGGGRNLQAVIDSRLFGEIENCDIVAVVSSNPDAYALARARAAGLTGCVVDRDVFPNVQSFNEAIFHKLRDLDAELVVLAGFTEKLSDAVIRHYKNRIIGVHPSLMPAFSGTPESANTACAMALETGVRITGATAYFLTETPCAGPIILQQAVEVLPDDSPKSLSERVMSEAEWSILPRAVALYCAGALEVVDGRVLIHN